MKKLTTILFILITLVIAFFIIRESVGKDNKEKTTVVSFEATENTVNKREESMEAISDIQEFDVMIPLFPDEIVVLSTSLDFDDDYYPDQIVAVKDSTDPYIKILVCLYNDILGTFDRTYKINTVIERTESFSFDILDITGTHAYSIVAYGLTDKNESLLYAWLSDNTAFSLKFTEIAAIKAEGTTLIHQIARNSSYAFSKQDGESFPIWAYNPVPGAPKNSLDQMHIVYDWSDETQQYEKKSEKLIYGKSITAQDFAKIFDGTEKTIGTFLNSTWVQKNTNGRSISVYFDYPQRSIIFLDGNSAESYTWGNSIMRTNGILIYAENVNIPTLLRRVGVTLVSANEIRIIATDALSLVTTPDTLWDGTYKKQGIEQIEESIYYPNHLDNGNLVTHYKENLVEKSWSSDFNHVIDFNDSTFVINSGKVQDNGVYSLFYEYNKVLLQCKTQSETGFLHDFYELSIIEEDDSLMQLVLTPVTIGLTQLTPSIDSKIILEEVIVDSETN